MLLSGESLVKTVRFANPKYIGDPLNAVRIFNDKEVDEIFLVDIDATRKKAEPDFDLIQRISNEAFMPFGYAGGITNVEQVQKLFRLGVEKIGLNNICLTNPEFVSKVAALCGNQSVVVCIDVKKNFWGKYRVFDYLNKKCTDHDPIEYAKDMVARGAGEFLVTSVDNEGAYTGYDIKLLASISSAVNVPVVGLGGASTLDDFKKVRDEGGVSAAAAGSFFVLHGEHKAVLITYPSKSDLQRILGTK